MLTGLRRSGEKVVLHGVNSDRGGLEPDVLLAGRAEIVRHSSLAGPSGLLNLAGARKVLRAAVRLVAPHPGVDLPAAVNPVRLSGRFVNDLRGD